MMLYSFLFPFLSFIPISVAIFSFNRIPFNLLLDKIDNHHIHSLVFSPSFDYVFINDDTPETSLSFLAPTVSKQIFDESVLHNVDSFILPSPNIFIFPIVLFFIARYLAYVRRINANMSSTMLNNPLSTFLGGTGTGINVQSYLPEIISNISFVGYEDVLEECNDIFAFNRTAFNLVGAETPKGVLLEGPPGNGKTFLAKYIAQQTNSTFISVSGSEFVNTFVGVGAANVRELFEAARQNPPCIIFIDEIDSIGKKRTTSIQSASDEKDQTLNQILTEMDGFQENIGVIVMGATNRKELLDPALLRPGRFDRIIRLPLPDLISRKAILGEHAKTKALDSNVNLDAVAEMTSGFSGAQLKNLLNEAAILAARVENTTIVEKNLLDAVDKLTVGLIRKTDSRHTDTKLRVALHEMGHTFLCAQYPYYFKLKKVSIQSTYEGAGGYTLFQELPEFAEGGLTTKDLLKKRLIVLMGGKAAETLYYSDEYVSAGAIQDLKQANALARDMISQYGMGWILEPFYKEGVDPMTGMAMEYSQQTELLVDKESMMLVTEALAEAKRILEENWIDFLTAKERLLENTVLYQDDLYSIF